MSDRTESMEPGMLSVEICPDCSARLPANLPAGLCPRCLLRLGAALAVDLDAGPGNPERTESVGTRTRGSALSGRRRVNWIRTAGSVQSRGFISGTHRGDAPDPADSARGGRALGPAVALPTDRRTRARRDGRDLPGTRPRPRPGLAVKVIREEHRDQPEMVRRFVEEAQIGGQLQHPGIVPVHELAVPRRPAVSSR